MHQGRGAQVARVGGAAGSFLETIRGSRNQQLDRLGEEAGAGVVQRQIEQGLRIASQRLAEEMAGPPVERIGLAGRLQQDPGRLELTLFAPCDGLEVGGAGVVA